MPPVKESPVRTAAIGRTLVAASALWSCASQSADVTAVPQIDMRVEQNDNFNLAPEGVEATDTEGYIADAQVLVGIANPRGETLLRPRVKVQEFPDRDDLERIETFFDVQSEYRWQRSTFLANAGYSKRDVYSTETLGGDFDPLDPDNGGDPEAGPITTGETRQLFEVRPTFEHRLTERTSLGVGVEYQTARYDSDDVVTKTDYDYGVAGTYLRWALSTQSDFTVGAYTSLYETRDDTEESEAIGGQLGYAYRWSETDGVEATVFYEQNDITETLPVPAEESTSDVGGTLSVFRRFQVSIWRLSLGRRFLPTGDRGKSTLDEIRLQYDRDLSQRLAFRGAARYESRSGFSTIGAGDERDYARVDLSMRWAVTPTWYVGGGYAYIWQDREADPSDADNNKFFINFGYRGLSPRPLPTE
jgi:hypothetical protein